MKPIPIREKYRLPVTAKEVEHSCAAPQAAIIVAALLAATAAHAETIYLKCWARGLTGDQRNSVYINGEQVTVDLDEGTMHSWTFGSNLASTSRICTCSLRRRLRSATFGNICSTRPLSGKVSSTASTARLRRINATVLSSAGTARSSRSGSFDGDQDGRPLPSLGSSRQHGHRRSALITISRRSHICDLIIERVEQEHS